ncbi:MAG: hypothetical protein OER59_08710 [Desulfobulbaceae bacterium]|nr:hypothetical protein [Desulfobulbaceae bacterium]
MSNTPTMNFQAYLADTYRIIKEEPVILILGGVVVQLLTILSLGILAGPFLGGYFLLIIYFLRDNKKPSFNDIFSGLQQFGNLFPFVLVILIIFIGFMLLVLPGLLFATWWLYVLPLMVDRKISFSEAMRLSMNKVNETGFLMHFVFLLLISVIPMMLLNFLSAMMPFLLVLKILLPPFQAGCLASLYIDKFGLAETKDLHEEEEVETAPAEVPVPQIAGATEQTAAVEEDTPAANETPDDLSSNTERQNHSHENDDGQEKN